MIAQGQGGVCGSEREKRKHQTDGWPAMAWVERWKDRWIESIGRLTKGKTI